MKNELTMCVFVEPKCVAIFFISSYISNKCTGIYYVDIPTYLQIPHKNKNKILSNTTLHFVIQILVMLSQQKYTVYKCCIFSKKMFAQRFMVQCYQWTPGQFLLEYKETPNQPLFAQDVHYDHAILCNCTTCSQNIQSLLILEGVIT